MSSNATYFEPASCQVSGPKRQENGSQLQAYDSFYSRFLQVLKRGDAFLVHLMLRQATYTKNRRLTRNMLKALVNQAVKVKK